MALTKLPAELLEAICAHLSSADLLSLICVSWECYSRFEAFLYTRPAITEQKYRLGRFLLHMLAHRHLVGHMKSFVLEDHAPSVEATNEEFAHDTPNGLIADLRDAIMSNPEFMHKLQDMSEDFEWSAGLTSPALALDAGLLLLLSSAENLQSIEVSYRESLPTTERHDRYPIPLVLRALLPSSPKASESIAFPKLKRLTVDTHSHTNPSISILSGLEHIRVVHRSGHIRDENHTFPRFHSPSINHSACLRSIDLTGALFQPEQLTRYLSHNDCRSLRTLKIFSDQRAWPPPWMEMAAYSSRYDFRKLSDALQHAPNLESFECSFAQGWPIRMFGSFKPLTHLQVFSTDFDLMCKGESPRPLGEIRPSPHLQEPTEYFPVSLRILHVMDISRRLMDALCDAYTKTPAGRARSIHYVLDRVRLLPLRELHVHVSMARTGVMRFVGHPRSSFNLAELNASARKFLPRLVAELGKEGIVMKVWRATAYGWVDKVLLYGPGYSRPWPHWSPEEEVDIYFETSDGEEISSSLSPRDSHDCEFPEDSNYVESDDDAGI